MMRRFTFKIFSNAFTIANGHTQVLAIYRRQLNRTFHVLRKADFNLPGTVKLLGADQEAGRGKASHGQHTYCITPGISMLSPHLFRASAAATGKHQRLSA
jgi:hypothetical protein